MEEKKVLLSIRDLWVKFHVRGRTLTAIRNVSLDIYEDESIAIVGESGCGKSVLTKTFAGMLDNNGFIDGGDIYFNDDSITDVSFNVGSGAIARAEAKLNEYSLLELGAATWREIQDLELANGKKVYEHMGDLVAEWGKDLIGKYGYSDIGAVVGATYPEQGAQLRKRLPGVFFLIPGYGAQGGSAESIKGCFDERGLGGIVNNSRGIICAYKKPRYSGMSYYEAARAACIDMREDLAKALGKMGR